ncbi:MAG: hypothetical protein QM756_08415 [Polyangiaceae bacterium]
MRQAILKRGASAEVAAEIAQQSFFDLFFCKKRAKKMAVHLGKLQPELGSLHGWLAKFGQRIWANRCAREERIVLAGTPSELPEEARWSELPSMEARLAQKRRAQIVKSVFERLRQENPRPLAQRVLDELYVSYSEKGREVVDAKIAEQCSSKEPAVRQQRRRLKRKCEAYLKRERARHARLAKL